MVWEGEPILFGQHYTADSEWIEETKYGSGSYIKWKQVPLGAIFDEVHRCGGTKTLQSKLLIGARRQMNYVMTLSATAADDPRQMKALGFALGLHTLNDNKNAEIKTGFRSWLFKHGCYEDDDTGTMTFTLSEGKRKRVFTELHQEIFPSRGARMRKTDIPGFPKSKVEVKYLFDETGTAKQLSKDLKDKYELLKGMDFYAAERQALELLMIPDVMDLFDDLVPQTRVAIFVNYTETLNELVKKLSKKYGKTLIGFIDGSQSGKAGEAQRLDYLHRFQANQLLGIVCNIGAASESMGLHDPTGEVERSTLIFPCDSGRRLRQVLGRVDRIGGGNSTQFLLYFKGTSQEETARRVEARLDNLDLLNDADLR